jgi:hypothetical protein
MSKLECDCGRPEGQHTRLDCGVPLRWMTETDPWPMRHSVKKEVVLASDYDALQARLAEAERLIRTLYEAPSPESWGEARRYLRTAVTVSAGEVTK